MSSFCIVFILLHITWRLVFMYFFFVLRFNHTFRIRSINRLRAWCVLLAFLLDLSRRWDRYHSRVFSMLYQGMFFVIVPLAVMFVIASVSRWQTQEFSAFSARLDARYLRSRGMGRFCRSEVETQCPKQTESLRRGRVDRRLGGWSEMCQTRRSSMNYNLSKSAGNRRVGTLNRRDAHE